MKFLAIDFEATDKEPKTARPTEAAWCEFEDPSNPGKPESQFIYHKDYQPMSQEVIDITGITDEKLKMYGLPFVSVYNAIVRAMPDFIVAHNKGYDRTLFEAECVRQQLPKLEIPWICTFRDIKWPEKFKCKKLSHLALDHGIMVDPALLHRAEGDIILMMNLLTVAKVDMVALAQRAMIPEITIKAIIPKPWDDGGKGKDKAKACGFGWQVAPGTDGPEFHQSWVKRIKENELPEEKEKLGYVVKIL